MIPPGGWRRLSLRGRLVLLGTLGLAVGLGAGGVLLDAVLGEVVRRSVDTEIRQTGQDVARLVNERALPEPAPVAGGQLVQVVDTQHRVRSASINADRLVPLLRESEIQRVQAGRIRYIPGERAGLTGPLRVLAVPAGPPDDPQVVIVARPVADLQHGIAVARNGLILGYPLLVVMMAVLGWRVAGAVLRPVEALRAGAERITGTATAERLPVPPSRDEIHRLAVTLNGMIDRLAGASDRQRAFVADAAHELRSPLASIRTQIEVAQRVGDSAGETPELLADLLLDVERLARLVDDLLTLARAEGEVAPIRAEPVDLTELLTEVTGRYATARVTVQLAPPGVGEPESTWTVGDCRGLARVFGNLLDNAVRHARSRVAVSVRPATIAGGQVTVRVADDGPGIAEPDRERVFGRFTRLDDARSRGSGGSGLGLAIVRELVRRHGGTIRLAATDPARGANPGLLVEVGLPAGRQPEVVSRTDQAG